MSYKDTFLYVMGKKFMDTDGRASRREFFPIYILVECSNNLYISSVLRVDCYI